MDGWLIFFECGIWLRTWVEVALMLLLENV